MINKTLLHKTLYTYTAFEMGTKEPEFNDFGFTVFSKNLDKRISFSVHQQSFKDGYVNMNNSTCDFHVVFFYDKKTPDNALFFNNKSVALNEIPFDMLKTHKGLVHKTYFETNSKHYERS